MKHKVKSVKSQLIPNNYKGKTAEQVWNGWNQGQRLHFLEDHFEDYSQLLYATKKFDEISQIIALTLKKHIGMGQYETGGKTDELVLYNTDDLAEFWDNHKNDNKTIFFIEKMEGEDDKGKPEHYYVVGNQTREDYDNGKYWDFDGSYETTEEAIKEAKKAAKKKTGGVYAKNLRLIRGFKDGGFFSKAQALAKSGAAKAKSAYEKATPHVKAAYEKTKSTVKQKIHDEKKKAAVDVLKESSNLGGLSSKEKSELVKAKNIVQDYYEDGGKAEKVNREEELDKEAFENQEEEEDNVSDEEQQGLTKIEELNKKIKKSSSMSSGGKAEKIKKCPIGTRSQTIILSKDRFKSEEAAKSWAHSHGFKFGNVVEKKKTYHLRQEEPEEFKKPSFRTIELTNGVQSVIGCPVNGKSSVKSKLEDGGKSKSRTKTMDIKYGTPIKKGDFVLYTKRNKEGDLISKTDKESEIKNIEIHENKIVLHLNDGTTITDYDPKYAQGTKTGSFKKGNDEYYYEVYEEMKNGGKYNDGGISRSKAKTILHEGVAHGHPISDKQRRFFGARASGYPVKRKEYGGYEHGGIYQDGGQPKTIEDLSKFVYIMFLERCRDYFQKDPLIESIEEEIRLVNGEYPEALKRAVRYYQNKTNHKSDIFKQAGAEELAKAFINASRKAEDSLGESKTEEPESESSDEDKAETWYDTADKDKLTEVLIELGWNPDYEVAWDDLDEKLKDDLTKYVKKNNLMEDGGKLTNRQIEKLQIPIRNEIEKIFKKHGVKQPTGRDFDTYTEQDGIDKIALIDKKDAKILDKLYDEDEKLDSQWNENE